MHRWGSLKDLAEVSGFSVRTLQYIQKQEPRVLITHEKGKGVEYDLGACNANLRVRERELAIREAGPKDFDEARTRKMAADARLAELELEERAGRMVTVDEATQAMDERITPLRDYLLTLPQRWAPDFFGCKTVQELTVRIDKAVQEAMRSLSQTVD